MEDLPKELLPVLQLLLPGFLTTMAFYWFAEVNKPSQFERVLQAMVCTPLIQLALNQVEKISYFIGQYCSLGVWTADSKNISSIFLAVVLGTFLAYICNNDLLYTIARKMKITSRSAQGDQIDQFKKSGGTTSLFHLKDGRSISGYITNFPSNSSPNTFFIKQPEWVLEDGRRQENPSCSKMLIYSTDISIIEFTERK